MAEATIPAEEITLAEATILAEEITLAAAAQAAAARVAAARAAAQAAAQKVLLAEDVDRVIAVQKTVTALIWKEPMADGITLT